jgi:hypothetical protein
MSFAELVDFNHKAIVFSDFDGAYLMRMLPFCQKHSPTTILQAQSL